MDTFDGGYYSSNSFRKKWHDFLEASFLKVKKFFMRLLGIPMTVCQLWGIGNTEKLGKNFVKSYGKTMEFSYGCAPDGYVNIKDAVEGQLPKNDIYVYRMTMTNEDGEIVEYTPDYMRYRCEQIGVKTVPVFNQFLLKQGDPKEPNNKIIKNSVMLAAEEYCGSGKTLNDPVDPSHIREGVVVRIVNRPSFTAFKHKNFEFKVLSGIIKDTTSIEALSDDLINEM